MKNVITQKIGSQRVFRSTANGRFVRINKSRPKAIKSKRMINSSIKNGSLYSFRGQTVRALQICNNGLRLVGFHKSLFGFVKDSELIKIEKPRVTQYLNA